MKLRIQVQYLQPGDVVGSGEKVLNVIINSLSWPSSKCLVRLEKRDCIWGKYTIINVERNPPALVIDGSPVINSWNEGACYPKRRGT